MTFISKSWRLHRELRCSAIGVIRLVQTVLTFHLAYSD